MPISAIGNKRFASDAGVTLVEAMVALMIVALAAGAVLLMAPGPERAVRAEAERMAARMVFARDESIITNRVTTLIVTREGYGFERLEPQGWAPAAQTSPLRFRAWPDGMEARVELGAGEAGDERVARFDALGGASPARVVLAGAGARWAVSIGAEGGIDVAPAE